MEENERGVCEGEGEEKEVEVKVKGNTKWEVENRVRNLLVYADSLT